MLFQRIPLLFSLKQRLINDRDPVAEDRQRVNYSESDRQYLSAHRRQNKRDGQSNRSIKGWHGNQQLILIHNIDVYNNPNIIHIYVILIFELHRPDTSLSNETLGLATVTHLGDEASMVMQWIVNPPL